MNFSDYLTYSKSQLTNLDRFHLVRIVMGNEACDLDSTISACVYAYFLHTICPVKSEVLHIPVMSTKPSKFRLRKEVTFFLRENCSNMVFIDDMNLTDLKEQGKLQIVLVDHHSIHSELNNSVTEIIDHHHIKQNSIALKDSTTIKIELVGSCCTLVAETILSSTSVFRMTNEIAYLLTGPILFDTLNFSTTAGRATDKDKFIYQQLRSHRTTTTDDSKLYQELRKSSADITGMSVQDLLQKDVKQVAGPNMSLAISSLPTDYTVEKLFGQLKTMNDLDAFLAENNNADGVIILSLETNNDETKRQLGFYIKKFENMLPVNEFIQRTEHNLELRERGIPLNQARIKLFEQKNVQASRKQVLPLFEQFVKDFEPQNSS